MKDYSLVNHVDVLRQQSETLHAEVMVLADAEAVYGEAEAGFQKAHHARVSVNKINEMMDELMGLRKKLLGVLNEREAECGKLLADVFGLDEQKEDE